MIRAPYVAFRRGAQTCPMELLAGLAGRCTRQDQGIRLESVTWETGAVVGQYMLPPLVNIPRIFALPGQQCLLLAYSLTNKRMEVQLVSKEGKAKEIPIKLEAGDEIVDVMVEGSQVYLITRKWVLSKFKVEEASFQVLKSGAIPGAPERIPSVLVAGSRKDELALVAIGEKSSVAVIVDLNTWSVRNKRDMPVHCLKRYGKGYAALNISERTLSLLDADLSLISEVRLKRPEDVLIYWR